MRSGIAVCFCASVLLGDAGRRYPTQVGSGPHARVRRVESKLRHPLKASAYNTLQNAIDAAVSGGNNHVIVPCGTYAPVTITTSNIWLDGAGDCVIITESGSTATAGVKISGTVSSSHSDLTHDALIGSYVIGLSRTGYGELALTVGDYLVIQDTREDQAQTSRICAIDNLARKVTLCEQIYYAFYTVESSTVHKVTALENVKVSGIRVDGTESLAPFTASTTATSSPVNDADKPECAAVRDTGCMTFGVASASGFSPGTSIVIDDRKESREISEILAISGNNITVYELVHSHAGSFALRTVRNSNGVVMQACAHCEIDHVSITNEEQFGALLLETYRSIVSNFRADHCGEVGSDHLHIAYSTHVVVKSVDISTPNRYGFGLQLQGSHHAKLSRISITGQQQGGRALKIEASNSNRIEALVDSYCGMIAPGIYSQCVIANDGSSYNVFHIEVHGAQGTAVATFGNTLIQSGSVAGFINAGVNTLTPTSMGAIYPGSVLRVSNERVTVTATTSTTFTAAFAASHGAGPFSYQVDRYNVGDRFIDCVVTRNYQSAFFGQPGDDSTQIIRGIWGQVTNCATCKPIVLQGSHSSVTRAKVFK